MSTHLVCLGLAVLSMAALSTAQGPARVLHVTPNGNDGWSGTLPEANAARTDGPFATLERAREEARKTQAPAPEPPGAVVIEVAGGTYELRGPFELSAEDGGTAEAPVTYRARKGEEVRVSGGRTVTGWQPVTDPAVLARLDEAARGRVLQADLRAQGITDFGEMTPGPRWATSEPGLELFFNDRPMTLARWPNEGYVTMADVVGPTARDVRGTKGCDEGMFVYEGDRPSRWAGEKDVMLHGYWFWDWADQRQKVESIDAEKHRITLAKPDHDFGYRKGQWYYAYNLLPELDQPGEWYLDRDSGVLYFWPPEPIEGARATVSVTPTLVSLNNASHVTVQGLIFECSRGVPVTIAGGTANRLAGCVIGNVGGHAVSIGGTNNGLVGCDIYNAGNGGAVLSGGDRKTLTPGGNYVENCHLHHYGRWNPILKAAVHVDGVGQRVSHCLIENAPHKAILFGGNDHLFEFNEIHSVDLNANDAGAIYAGYNPTMRGNVIRYNYFHHLYGHEKRGCNGVYLDDMFCSAETYGNLFYEVHRAVLLGGGRDNLVENNVFVSCKIAVHVDARALGWASAGVVNLEARLAEMPYQEEPWRTRFPQLLTYLQDEPAVPKGNVVRHNIVWRCGQFDAFEEKARPHVLVEDNLVEQDPGFVDEANRDFRLREDSPAWALGFQAIPLERIGPYRDALRASWPVEHRVTVP
ncbi:MAG: hypothetical protein FJX74_09115 [Armatimonadetes bacterium]|nr:hypothetical protein [Armatimonadota bacterium]